MFSSELQNTVKQLGKKSYRLHGLQNADLSQSNWKEISEEVRKEYVSTVKPSRVWGTECQVAWQLILAEAEHAGESLEGLPGAWRRLQVTK